MPRLNNNFRYRIFSKGVVFMLIATLGFSIMHTLIKMLDEFHLSQIIFFRCAITGLLCMYFLKHKKIPFLGNKQFLLILRAILGIVSMGLFFITLQKMPMGVSVSIKYLSPFFAIIFATLLLKEKMKLKLWFFFFTALLGVFLLKGFDARIDVLSLILGVIGSIFGGLVYVVIRKIKTTEHPMVIINYFMVLGTLLSGGVMLFFWKHPTVLQWLILLGIGGFGYIGQIFMTKSIQLEFANRVTPIKYMEVVFSFIIGYFLFEEVYSFKSIIGIVVIFSSLFSILLYSKTITLKE